MITRADFQNASVAQLRSVRRYAPALVCNAAHEDDLVQDSIERALRQSSQLRELDKLPGWLRRIIYNKYMDELRRDRSRGRQQDITESTNEQELSIPAYDGTAMRDF